MNTSSKLELFISISGLLVALIGGVLSIVLINRSYLTKLWHDVDKIIKEENYQDLIDEFKSQHRDYFYKLSIRFIEVIISGIFLILNLPLFFFIALLIKLDSPGPVFFRHARIGQFGKKIHAYKFRTMRIMDEELTLNSKMTMLSWDDNRITRVGKFLRQTGLDELPNLVSILKGEMSFVGTSVATDYTYIDDLAPEVREIILQGKPGMTSLWVISGRRWEFDLNKRVIFDLFYVKNQSLLFDLSILIRTTSFVLGSAGAR